MQFQGSSRLLPFGVAVVLLLLLAVLATLQVRWVDELSRQERERVQAILLAAASGFTEDFDRELGRAFSDFSLSPLRGSSPEPAAPADEAARQYERWRAGTRYPRLLRGLYYVRTDGQGGLDLQVLRPAARRFEPCPWPSELAAVRRDLLAGTGEEMLEKFGSVTGLQADPPGLLSRKLLVPRQEPGGRPATEALFAWFDQRAIAEEILPDLARRHFGSAQRLDPVLAVVERRNPGKVIFLSDPRVPVESFRSAELRLDLFGLRSLGKPRPGLAPNVIETPANTPRWSSRGPTRSATCGSTSAAPRCSAVARPCPSRRWNSSCSPISSGTAGRCSRATSCSTRSGATTPCPPPARWTFHVASLRQKLERNPAHPDHILTVHRRGYRFAG